MNGTSAALLVMGVAVISLTAAVSGFKVTQHVSETMNMPKCDIVLQKRIDRAGSTLAIGEDSVVYHPEGDVIVASDTSIEIAFGCQCAAERARAISISTDGRTLVVGIPDARKVIVLRRKIQGAMWFEHQVVGGPPGFGASVTIAFDGARLFARGYASWTVLELAGDMFSVISGSTEDDVINAAVSPDFTHVAVVNESQINIRKIDKNESVWQGEVVGERVSSVAVGPGGEMAVVAYAASDILVFRHGRLIETVKNTVDGFGRSIMLTKSMCFIGSPYEDRVYVYSLPSFKHLTSLTPDEGGLNSEFGAQIAAGSKGIIAVLAPGYGDDERGAIFLFRDRAAGDDEVVGDRGHS
jgi:DNA-binding beta-propeller fold protein YncE